MARQYIVRHTDLSEEQVRGLEPEVLDKIYDWCVDYIDYHGIKGIVVEKVPSSWYQQVFYDFSSDYRRDSPFDWDHWGSFDPEEYKED